MPSWAGASWSTAANEHGDRESDGHATGTGVLLIAHVLMIMSLTCENKSGRRESNPHDQLGRLGLCH